MHGCRSHQHPSLFIPHRKRCKGGIAPACCRLRLMLHPLRAQWVPSRGPLGGGRSRRFRGPGPFSERWPRWVGRVFSPVFPNPLRIDHVAFPISVAAAAPVLRSPLPLVPPQGAWLLPGALCIHVPLELLSTPSQPKPITSVPRLRSLQQPQTQPTVSPTAGWPQASPAAPCTCPRWAQKQRGHRLLPGTVGGGHFMAWSDSLPCHPFPCEQHRVTSKCGGGTTS